MLLDEIKHLHIAKQKNNFPLHYHETFCISFIRKGLEQLDIAGKSILSEHGQITITNPYELHASPLAHKDMHLSFDTLYISEELMRYFLGGQNIKFDKRQITDTACMQLYDSLIQARIQMNDINIQHALSQFIPLLAQHAQWQKEDHQDIIPRRWQEVHAYIDNNLTQKIKLDQLAHIANMNKYSFSKQFKRSTGMTPFNYVLMKKVFAARQLIDSHTDLTQLAYQFDFTDMAHFSKTFKRFVGLSPKLYKSQYYTSA